jgi:diguanylate cyclase (GGDEF)-like protein
MEIMRDVSVIDAVNRDLKELADKDELTGLSRRHVLFNSLQREAARNQRHGNPFSVLMIDIDDFKSYNDRFGHQAGDEVLRVVGRILREETRQEDTVGRYGGEEFLSVLVESRAERAMLVAERVLERVRETTSGDAPDGEPVTVSVGVASCDGGGVGCDSYSMIRRADDALYEAKWAGKDKICVAREDEGRNSEKEGDA